MPENSPYENRKPSVDMISLHQCCLMTTSLQLKPLNPLFVVKTHLLGYRIPRSHCPVTQINIPVKMPPIRQTFSTTSTTQYTEPPTPLPSSRGLRNNAYPKYMFHSPRSIKKNVCCRRLVRSCNHCARSDASRIKRLR